MRLGGSAFEDARMQDGRAGIDEALRAVDRARQAPGGVHNEIGLAIVAGRGVERRQHEENIHGRTVPGKGEALRVPAPRHRPRNCRR
jgi:hypothetical protein